MRLGIRSAKSLGTPSTKPLAMCQGLLLQILRRPAQVSAPLALSSPYGRVISAAFSDSLVFMLATTES
jgi:hypothetical protein